MPVTHACGSGADLWTGRLGPVVDLPLPALRRPQAVTQEGPATGTHEGGVRVSHSIHIHEGESLCWEN